MRRTLLKICLSFAVLGAVFQVATTQSGHAQETDTVGVASVVVVGDSLVSASPKLYAEKLRAVGMTVQVDAVGSRALRFGWQCRDATGRLVILKQPSSRACRREGLEVLSNLRQTNALPDAVVIALGTNDAGLFKPAEIISSLNNARKLIGERPLFIVSVKKLTSSKKPGIWNSTASGWCASDINCNFLDWASSPDAAVRAMYGSDRVHLTSAGLTARASFIALGVQAYK